MGAFFLTTYLYEIMEMSGLLLCRLYTCSRIRYRSRSLKLQISMMSHEL